MQSFRLSRRSYGKGVTKTEGAEGDVVCSAGHAEGVIKKGFNHKEGQRLSPRSHHAGGVTGIDHGERLEFGFYHRVTESTE